MIHAPGRLLRQAAWPWANTYFSSSWCFPLVEDQVGPGRALKLFLSRWIRGIKRSSSTNLFTNIYNPALNNLHRTLTFTVLWNACQPPCPTPAPARVGKGARLGRKQVQNCRATALSARGHAACGRCQAQEGPLPRPRPPSRRGTALPLREGSPSRPGWREVVYSPRGSRGGTALKPVCKCAWGWPQPAQERHDMAGKLEGRRLGGWRPEALGFSGSEGYNTPRGF